MEVDALVAGTKRKAEDEATGARPSQRIRASYASYLAGDALLTDFSRLSNQTWSTRSLQGRSLSLPFTP